MEQLINLLKDGKTRTIELLAIEMHTTISDVERKIEYLENMGIIKRVSFKHSSEKNCSSCPTHGKSPDMCKGCMPADGFKNMGEMWQYVLNDSGI